MDFLAEFVTRHMFHNCARTLLVENLYTAHGFLQFVFGDAQSVRVCKSGKGTKTARCQSSATRLCHQASVRMPCIKITTVLMPRSVSTKSSGDAAAFLSAGESFTIVC